MDCNSDKAAPTVKVTCVDADENPSKQYLFTSKFTVGRSLDNDCVIQNPLVSRYHFRVEWEDGCWWVYNLNSSNGIYLNHQLVYEKSVLNLPVIISLGAVNIHLKIEEIQQNKEINLLRNNVYDESEKESFSENAKSIRNLSKDELKDRLLAKTEADDLGDYTRMVRKIIHEDRTNQFRGYKKIIFGWLAYFLYLLVYLLISKLN